MLNFGDQMGTGVAMVASCSSSSISANFDMRWIFWPINHCMKGPSQLKSSRKYDCRSVNIWYRYSSLYHSQTLTDCYICFANQGYKKKNAYIATQHPLHETITDFWNMIYQREVTTIVLLNRLKDGPQVGAASLLFLIV